MSTSLHSALFPAIFATSVQRHGKQRTQRRAVEGPMLCHLIVISGLVLAMIDSARKGDVGSVAAILVSLAVVGIAVKIGLSLALLEAVSLRTDPDSLRSDHDHPVMEKWRSENAAVKAEAASAGAAWQRAIDEIRAEAESSGEAMSEARAA